MHPTPLPEAPQLPVSLLDKANTRSVVNIVPGRVRTAIEEAYFECEELFKMDERDLFKHLRSLEKTPSPTDNRLRLKFWVEYDRVQASGEAKMNMTAVLASVCHQEYFFGKYLGQPHKVAWLLCPPTGYMVKAEEALEFGLEQLRDILEQPHIVAGKVDTKLGELKAKIVGMLDTRVKGAPIQKNLNLNVSTSNEAVAKAAAAETMETLDRRLKELQNRERASRNLPLANPSDVAVEFK